VPTERTHRLRCPPSACQSDPVRTTLAVATVLASVLVTPGSAAAEPTTCGDPSCVPGIAPGVVLGAPCSDTAYFVFGTTSWGRLVFCGSPRRYEPRYFRSPSMAGVKEFGSSCEGYENWVAQAPDGLFLSCQSRNGTAMWGRGD
jgi:hypothetical protein